MTKKKTEAEHDEAILCATRGSIGDYQEAVLAAVRDGHLNYYRQTINDICWAKRVLQAEKGKK